MSSTPLPPENIIQGTNEIITLAINARTGGSKSFKSITTAREAEKMKIPADQWQFAPVIEELWQQIEQNWVLAKGLPRGKESKENGRWKLKTKMTEGNPSLETQLEKGLARVLPEDFWANQVPTASGLVGPKADRKRNIDLARWEAGTKSLTLIELKVRLENSPSRETPIYAAFELIRNALLLCLSRAFQDSNSPRINVVEPKIWIEAAKVHLLVLAPKSFYQGFERSSVSIEEALDQAVARFGKAHALDAVHCPEMSFGFRVFDWSSRPSNEKELLECLNQRIPR